MANSQHPQAGSHAHRLRAIGMALALFASLASDTRLYSQAAGVRGQAVPQVPRTSGPIAIGAFGPRHLAVLQADGALFDLDVTTGHATLLYRVPETYQVLEAAAGGLDSGPVVGIVICERKTSNARSYLLQVGKAGEPIWSVFPPRGLFLGITLEESRRVAFVGNASNGDIYELPLGSKSATPQRLMGVMRATRLGWLTYDRAAQTIYAADLDAGQVYRVDVRAKTSELMARLQGAGDVRAIAWVAAERRLLFSDSERQTVWAVNVAGHDQTARRFITDAAFREPAGLAVLDGSLWIADEGAQMLFEVAPATGAVIRRLPWHPGP